MFVDSTEDPFSEDMSYIVVFIVWDSEITLRIDSILELSLQAIKHRSSHPFIKIIYSCSRWWLIPYYWAGIKCYDLVAGSQLLKPSYFLSKAKALELFPMLKKDKLCGALVYYDGK